MAVARANIYVLHTTPFPGHFQLLLNEFQKQHVDFRNVQVGFRKYKSISDISTFISKLLKWISGYGNKGKEAHMNLRNV